MRREDLIHQAQDVLDRVAFHSAPLLPTRVHNTGGDGSGVSAGSSMLTNVAPPAALPSFLTSPLPAPAPATASAMPQFPPPPGATSPVPPPSTGGGGHPVRPPGTTPIPSPGTRPIRPLLSSPVPPPTGSVPLVRPPIGTPVPPPSSTSVATQGPPPSMTFSPQSPPSPYPPPPPVSSGPTQHPPASGQPAFSPVVVTGAAAAAATTPPPAASQPSSFTSQSPHTIPSPVTSQPQQPTHRSSMSQLTKGHSRHHSYPLYFPGNPLHNPPPPPTPPCLVVQQEQNHTATGTSLPLSHSHHNLSTDPVTTPVVPTPLSRSQNDLHRAPAVPSASQNNNSNNLYNNAVMSRSFHSGVCVDLSSGSGSSGTLGEHSFVGLSSRECSSVGYGYAYPLHSAGGVDESAAVDLGGVGIGGGSPSVDGTHAQPAGRGWFGWIRGTVSHVGHRVAERAKTSMDTMITTLDPQMKEFIHSGGDVDIVVASDKEVKVGAVREAFQMMFGKATVSGVASQVEGVAAQPVGFEAALQSAEERINFLRCSGKIHPQQPIVAVENFIVELTPDCWYDLGVLLLDDPGEDIILQTYTQVTPVPPDYVNQAKSSTPDDYPHRSTGLAIPIGQIASQQLQVHHTLWQESLTGVARRELVVLAARTLAGLYRSRLSHSH